MNSLLGNPANSLQKGKNNHTFIISIILMWTFDESSLCNVENCFHLSVEKSKIIVNLFLIIATLYVDFISHNVTS